MRFSDQVDPHTRTIGVVIGVDRPLEKAIPGQRPRCPKGMFVQVVINGTRSPTVSSFRAVRSVKVRSTSSVTTSACRRARWTYCSARDS